jgi:pimeloyl-ACP methyl ester carboxylesterase
MTDAPAVQCVSVRLDVSDADLEGCSTIAADVLMPAASDGTSSAARDLVVCFPGGGMSRKYHDLSLEGYSFARYLVSQGFVVAIIDHPGTGQSDSPTDGWALTPEAIARTELCAVRDLDHRLQQGGFANLPNVEVRRIVGVGHSAGAFVLIHQQGLESMYDGIALLGWSASGLPDFLDDAERALAAGDGPSAQQLIEVARRRFGEPYVELMTENLAMLVSEQVPAAVKAMAAEAGTRLLTVLGNATLIPQAAARFAKQVRTPVFVGIGEHDIALDAESIPASFPQAASVTMFVLAGAGHNQHLEPNRRELWSALSAWAAKL